MMHHTIYDAGRVKPSAGAARGRCDRSGAFNMERRVKGKRRGVRTEPPGIQSVEIAARIFDPRKWRAEEPLRVVLIGTDFQVRVWEGLLRIPMGRATTYSALAGAIGRPEAPRAVGAAVGANPVSFVVPCHRALGKSGALTGYHWGLTRKRAMLGWEAGHAI